MADARAAPIEPQVEARDVPEAGLKRLVRAACSGEPEACDELVARYWPSAYRTAYLVIGDAAEAEDIAQEALLSALKSISRFRVESRFEPWLHRIVVNKAIDAWRARSRRPTPVPDIGRLVDADAPSDFDDESLADAIISLPIEQRSVVVLRYALGYGAQEISDLLDIPRGTVGSRLRRALDLLSVELKEQP